MFDGAERALRKLAVDDPAACDHAVKVLRDAESDELRFLACRVLAVRGTPDDAVEWLLADPRNLVLGWSDSPRWASRELIQASSAACSDRLFARLEQAILGYWPDWERRQFKGHSQYELLSGVDRARLSEVGRRRLGELERRFPQSPPEPPQPVVAHFVGAPIGDEPSKRMSDDDWLRALRKHTGEETDWRRPVPVGGARELAQVLGRRAKEEPERFARLALRFDEAVPAAAITNVIDNVAGAVDVELLTDVCEHARDLHGSEVGRAICGAAEKIDDTTRRIVTLVTACAEDSDPDHESARTPAYSGEPFFGGDLFMAGLNSTRGEAALAAASILFATEEHLAALLPVVERLAVDDILAVRVCAAEAVCALLNRVPERALAIAERLFDAHIDVHDATTTERLLVFAVMRDPERFAPTLRRVLGGPDPVAKRAGTAWAVAFIRDAVPKAVTQDFTALPPAVRRGAAAVLADPESGVTVMDMLLNDGEAEVRESAARVLRYVGHFGPDNLDDLIRSFMASPAFDDHFDDLVHGLEELRSPLPSAAIEACEQAVAGAELADIRTARSLASRGLLTVLLRLYRQGHAKVRVRCLDLIDRLTELNVNDVTNALEAER